MSGSQAESSDINFSSSVKDNELDSTLSLDAVEQYVYLIGPVLEICPDCSKICVFFYVYGV